MAGVCLTRIQQSISATLIAYIGADKGVRLPEQLQSPDVSS